MKPDLTLKHLADLGAEAALEVQEDRLGASMLHLSSVGSQAVCYEQDRPAREAFVKTVLDAVGYQFPVDPEREAYEKWFSSHPSPEPYDAWKAGREELRKQSGQAIKQDPPWIEWKGGPCPIPDTVKRWEYRCRDGFTCQTSGPPSAYSDGWEYEVRQEYHFVAYRVLDWGNTETFEAHGHTWFKHTPGDPMPCAEGSRVQTITRSELAGDTRWDDFVFSAKENFVWQQLEQTVGWRYAE